MENGQHFWATMDDKLVMMGKIGGRYYVCGAWEISISEDEFTFIANVERPKGYEKTELYYDDEYEA